jgi:soluble P-type ATPase
MTNLLGKEKCVAIGNGANDVLMLKQSAIGICVIGKEGASAEAVQHSDIVVYDVSNALDLLLYRKRLIATLRK